MEYPTPPAYRHLFGPALLGLPPADGAIDKPAEIPYLQFPRRAILPQCIRAVLHDPTGNRDPACRALHGKEKEHMPFYVRRDFPPALFKALHGLVGRPQELGHLLLGLSQLMPDL